MTRQDIAHLQRERDAAIRELHDIEAVLREAYPGTLLLGDTLARKVVMDLLTLRRAAARMSTALRHAHGIHTEDEKPRARPRKRPRPPKSCFPF